MRWLELPNFDGTVTGRGAPGNRLVAAVAGAVAGASYLAPTYCIAGETARFGAAGVVLRDPTFTPRSDQIRSDQLHAGLKLRLKLKLSHRNEQ
jgi:hypothetical protein